MRRAALIAALMIALSVAVPASGRSLGALSLDATFSASVSGFTCPQGTPSTTVCYASEGTASVPGLGSVTETFHEAVANADTCPHTTFSSAVLAVAGKGNFDMAMTDPNTCDPDFSNTTSVTFTVSGGTGVYAGASGSGTMTFSNFRPTGSNSSDETHGWTGQVSAGTTFDTTPPVISGTKALLVKTKKKSVRVHYSPTATDAVDGSVPVTCLPKSGSSFKVGKTTVTCTATDSSANTATARFAVKVKRVR